jgi:hypothetical protein
MRESCGQFGTGSTLASCVFGRMRRSLGACGDPAQQGRRRLRRAADREFPDGGPTTIGVTFAKPCPVDRCRRRTGLRDAFAVPAEARCRDLGRSFPPNICSCGGLQLEGSLPLTGPESAALGLAGSGPAHEQTEAPDHVARSATCFPQRSRPSPSSHPPAARPSSSSARKACRCARRSRRTR